MDPGNTSEAGATCRHRFSLERGSTKTKQFRGQPKTVEFVYARSTSKKTYPFQFKFQRPTYPADSFFKRVAVETQSRRAFLSQRVSVPKGEICSKGSLEFQSRPFYICLNQSMYMQSKWKKAREICHGNFPRSFPGCPGHQQ